MKKRTKKKLIIAGSLIIFFLAGLFLFIHSPLVKNKIIQLAADNLRENQDIQLKIRNLKYNLFNLQVVLKGLSVGAGEEGEVPFFEAEELQARLSSAIISGKLRFREIKVKNPQINIQVGPEGERNLPRAESPKEDSGPSFLPEIIIEQLEIKEASLSFIDEQSGFSFLLPGFDISGEKNEEANHTFRLDLAKEGLVKTEQASFPLNVLRISGLWSSQELDIDSLLLQAKGMTLEGKGSLGNPLDLFLYFELESLIDLEQFLSLTSLSSLPGGRLRGRLKIKSHLQGPPKPESLILKAEIEGEKLSYNSLEDGRITAQLLMEKGSLEMPSFVLGSSLFQMKGDARFSPFLKNELNQLNLKWESFRPNFILQAMEQPFRLGSVSRGYIRLGWEENFLDSLRGESEIHFIPFSPEEELLKGLPLRALIKAEAQAGRLSVLIENISLPGMQLKGNLRLKQEDLSGKIILIAEQPEKTFSLIEPYLPLPLREQIEQADFSGMLEAEAEIGGKRSSPRMDLELSLENPVLFEKKLDKIEASLRYAENIIKMNYFSAVREEGRLEGEGEYNLLEKDYRLKFNCFDFPLLEGDLPQALSSLGASVYFNFEGKSKSRTSIPGFSLKGRLVGITWEGINLGELEFQARNPQEEIEFSFSLPQFSSRGQGSVQTSHPFSFKASVDVKELSLNELLTRFFPESAGEISGELRASLETEANLAFLRETLKARLSLQKLELEREQYWIKTDKPASLRFSPHGFEVEDLSLSGNGFSLQADGELPTKVVSEKGLLITGRVDPGIASGLIEGLELEGGINLNILLNGLLLQPVLSGGLKIEDASLSLSTPPVEVLNLNAGLSFSQGWLNLEGLSFLLNGSPFEVKGRFPQTIFFPGRLREENASFEPGEIRTIFQNLEPFFFVSFLSEEFAGKIRGRLSGEAEFQVKDTDWRSLSGSLSFDEFTLEVPGISLKNDRVVKLLLDEGILYLSSFSLKNSNQSLEFRGKVDFVNEKITDAGVRGEANLDLIAPFFKEWLLSGKTTFEVDISGPLNQPQIDGVINLSRGGLQRVSPYILLSDLEGKVRITGDKKILLEEFKGQLNDGLLSFKAEVDFSGWKMNRFSASMNLEEIGWHFPPGVEAKFSSDLSLNTLDEQFLVEGRVNLHRAKYSEDFSLQSALVQYLKRPRGRASRVINPLLNQINLNITVITQENILVSNNLSRAEIGASLRLVGTAQSPAFAGRAQIKEGGELYFHGQTFLIEQGTVDFLTEIRIEPYLQLQAETRVKSYDIRLSLSGTPETLSASFVSEPPLPEPDIISLLITGRTLEDVSGSVLEAVGYEALSFLNSALTGRLEAFAARFLGIESVKIDAALIASEENPAARITFEQHLYRNLLLTLSQDLKDAQNRTWIIDYTPFQNLNLQGVKRDDNLYILHLRHELRFGGVKEEEKRLKKAFQEEKVVFGEIEWEGNLLYPENVVQKQLKIRKGKPYRFVKLLEGMERLRRFYRKQGFLEFNLSKKTERTGNRVNLFFQVEPGPVVEVEFEGASVPRKISRKSQEIWVNSLSSRWAAEEIRSLLKKHFFKNKYYEVRVEVEEKLERDGIKRMVFSIEPGLSYEKTGIIFSGNDKVSDQRLKRFLRQSGGVVFLLEDSFEFTRKMEELLKNEGYLRCRVKLEEIVFNEEESRAIFYFTVDEGLRFTVREISLKGNKYLSEDWVRKEFPLKKGDIYREEVIYRTEEKLRKALTREGFHEAKIQVLPFYEEKEGRVDLKLEMEEGGRAVIGEINFQKAGITGRKTILRELEFKEGEILDLAKIQQSRKNLYGLGIFEWVDINIRKIDASGEPEKESGIAPEVPYAVEVNLSELKPVRLRYGLHGNSENLIGISGEIIHRNLGGKAHLAGSSFRLNKDERALRFFFRSPYFMGIKIPTDVSAFFERQKRPAFSLDRRGLSLQQQIWLKRPVLLAAVLSLEHEKAILPETFTDFQDKAARNFGMLNLALTRDTRNNIMDTESGSFFAQNLEYVPPFLGGGAGFFRSFSQYYFFQPLWKDVIYASGLRVGLGRGIGQELPLGRRYFAGGGATVRGFGRDEVRLVGGDALFIINQEIRFPVYKSIGGVVFLDAGNIYSRMKDFDPLNLRKSLGLGLRWNTPYVLLRFDWGFKLDRRPGEAASAVFIGIGQAF